jgi:metallo-beta-lactamase class B
MKSHLGGWLSAVGVAVVLAIALGSTTLIGQGGRDSVDSHLAAARAAAGQEHVGLFDRLCTAPAPPPATAAPPAPRAPAQPAGPPGRSTWHAEPVKVFDNLYFLGEIEYSAWALTTSAGIILIDAIYDYSVEDEVVEGMKKVGLDPAAIKYVIVSHGHRDHVGGARLLQERFGAHVIMSAADWELVANTAGSWPKPTRDLVATDGQRLTLGDTTVAIYLTPGHTLGTISTVIPVKDGGQPHVAAAWGGTAFNWTTNRAAYITPQRPDKFWFDTYIASVHRFRDIVAKAGADVLIANHTNFDGSKTKLPALAKRKPGDPHPYVIGNQSVQRYLTVADECAKAGLLRLK